MKRLYIIILLSGMLLASCGGNRHETEQSRRQRPVSTAADTVAASETGPVTTHAIVEAALSEGGSTEKRLAQMWDMANTLYINSDYAGAAEIYDSIVFTGYESAKLWYNLGNARFKEGAIGMAIADYNRALRLAPSDPDIHYNLAVANGYTKDRIEPLPEFFLTSWIKSVRSLLSSDIWSVLTLLFLGVMLTLVAVYLLAEQKKYRQAGFYGALIAAVMLLLTASFASSERRIFLDTSEGIIKNASVPVKSSPDKTGRDLFILHEGTEVRVTARLGEWAEVTVADGNKGWLRYAALEMIRPEKSPVQKP